MMKTVEIHTDGACRHNPGPGGWGALMDFGDKTQELYGGDEITTNNKMELTAVIKALEYLTEPHQIVLTTDSKYVIGGINDWMDNWKKRGWRNAKGEPVKNKELWERLDELNLSKNINWSWVKAHNVDEFNNQVDILARKAAENLTDSSFN